MTGTKAGDGCRAAQNAVEEILKFYHVPLREVPESVRNLEERLEYLLRPGGSVRVLLAAGGFLLCARAGALLFGSVQELLLARINTRLSLSVQAATMMRILSLPPDCFKTCGSGGLSSKAEYVNTLCDMLVSTVLSTALTSLFSLLYLPQIAAYAPGLALPALACPSRITTPSTPPAAWSPGPFCP